MMPLSSKDVKSYEKQKVCHICKKGGFGDDYKTRKKSEIIATIPENLEERLIANVI